MGRSTMRGGLRRSKRGRKCWTRRNTAGANYVVCNKSSGQKGVYKKKGRKSRKSRKGKGRKRGGTRRAGRR